jgi:peptidoglycan hydrolase-like protein with peptidoglycan-binding domain
MGLPPTMRAGDGPGREVDVASNQALPVIGRGSTGEAVRRLQRSLVIGDLLANTGIDGRFGPVTEQAVRSFQQAVGIDVDGIVGPQTWARLPEPPHLPMLRRGSTGDAVRGLQQGLAEIAKSWEVESPGRADGDFGPRTEASVRSFQRFSDLPVDGVVGDHTWYAQVGGVGRLFDFAGLGGD